MREVIKEYEGERLIRTIERNFDLCGTGPRSETEAKLQAMGEALNELDIAVKALDRKWMTTITQQRDSLLKELSKQLALDIAPVKKAQEGCVKEVESLRTSIFQLEKGKLDRLKDQLQKLRAAAPVLAAAPIQAARPGLPAEPVQEAKGEPPPIFPTPELEKAAKAIFAPEVNAAIKAEFRKRKPKKVLKLKAIFYPDMDAAVAAEVERSRTLRLREGKAKPGPVYEIGASDNTRVRVYCLRRNQYRVRYYERGERVSKDTASWVAARRLAGETNARLEAQAKPAPKALTPLAERLNRIRQACSSIGHGKSFRVCEAHDASGNIPAGQEGAGEVPGAAGGGDKPGQPA